MPIYKLTETPLFPPATKASDKGLLAFGGDLSTERLLAAYKNGIFPWYSEGDPILWWSPNPRLILFPQHLNCSKSLRRTIKKKVFEVKADHNFMQVMEYCSKVPRLDQEGTWITKEMKNAYYRLFQEGYAHSIETYYNDKLVGGLYGISLGKAFFGESMFFLKTDASKIALYYLVDFCTEKNFHFIDSQVSNYHMIRMGAIEISRNNYLKRLSDALKYDDHVGKWVL